MNTFTSHGGRLQTAMRIWPDAPAPWIDLSTGVNPTPYPAPRASRAVRARLPYPEEISAVEAVAALAFGIDDPTRVVATAGAEAALRLLPQLLKSETVMIAGPTYASHASAWSQAGARQVEHGFKVAVVVNPNNPDGRVHDAAALLALADDLNHRGGWLIVDESFADTRPVASIAAHGHAAVVALRSFGKFYGLAGLRLGFAIGDPELAAKIRLSQGDWPISADAATAAMAAYADPDWAARTRARLVRDAASLDADLLSGGFKLLGGTPLFRLVEADDASDRFAGLCARGVLTRPFAEAPSWLRFGLPHASVRRRVAQALRELA
jgi:cobalamin biosynthetic protein CobC